MRSPQDRGQRQWEQGPLPLVGGVMVAAALLLFVVAPSGCLEGTEERPRGSTCTADAQCGDSLRCLFGRCRAPCVVDQDCPDGATCESMGGDPPTTACVLPSDFDLARGEVCASEEECAGALICERITSAELKVCVEPCTNADDCPATAGRVLCTSESEATPSFCSIDCDPITGEPCGAGAHCALVALIDEDPDVPALTHCTVARGSGTAGDPCTSYSDCDVGHMCAAAEGCRQVCDRNSGAGCAEGSTCLGLDTPFLLRGTEYGLCF